MTGITTAVALFPDRGTEESAIPRNAAHAMPSGNIQAIVSQASGEVGRSMRSTAQAKRSSAVSRISPVTNTQPNLPIKYETGDSGDPPSRFSVPPLFSMAISIARPCMPESNMPAATMPGRYVAPTDPDGPPGTGLTLPAELNAAVNTPSMMMGKRKVKNTVSGERKYPSISLMIREKTTAIILLRRAGGSLRAAALDPRITSGVVIEISLCLSHECEVNVFQARLNNLEPVALTPPTLTNQPPH